MAVSLLFLGFQLLQSCMLSLALVPSNITDQSALVAFKSGISYDPNRILETNWSIGTDFCGWTGITCSTRRHRVTALRLPFMGLQGTISPHIGNLSFLQILVLANNSFHGHIPQEIGHLGRLKLLVLEVNQLAGVIPPSICQCKKLQVISLVFNNLSSTIPTELGALPQLHTLYLGNNNIVGTIPSSLGNISGLRELILGTNKLTGSIPDRIFNISSIVSIYLGDNFLSGPLPKDICQNSHKLEEILLESNQLSGHIPSAIYKCKALKQLSLSNNRFVGNVPAEIGSLPILQILYFNSNGFDGAVPSTLGSLSMLQTLYLGDNHLSGMIPPSIGNISSLEYLYLGNNSFHGSIPDRFGQLKNLFELNLESNFLSGVIPPAIFNISTLSYITLTSNSLTGKLPTTTGLRLPNLRQLLLQSNNLGGNIPSNLSSSSNLAELHLYNNSFSGPVPLNLGELQQLKRFNAGFNQLTGEDGISELRFFAALSNCSSLEWLVIEYNPLNGSMPSFSGNHSSPIQIFSAAGCRLQGPISKGIGSFKKINYLILGDNDLSGAIPSEVAGLDSLQRLYLDRNLLEGLIPNEICQSINLGELYFPRNKLSGIPSCIGNLIRLQKLDLSSNRFGSLVPPGLWTLPSLIFLNVSGNSLSRIPQSWKLDVIEILDLSSNRISGNVPSTIGTFLRLRSLNLSKNLLVGPIPETISSLVALDYLDLSYNNLSGTIPKSLEALKYLRFLNLSFNNLSGEVPGRGPFANFTGESFLANRALCGKPSLKIPPCRNTTSRSHHKQTLLVYIFAAIASLAALIAFICLFRACRTSKPQNSHSIDLMPAVEWRMSSYHDLVRATDNFCEANLLGVGSVSSVYRGILSDGSIVAVKVLNLQQEGGLASFDRECKILREIRHRNLVKVLSSCSNLDFKALILEYMPSGSLDKWLYSHNYVLNLFQRVSIMVDVALALEYLHHDQLEPIVHCDLKPNNVLLDEAMVAHLGDFGIAKILAKSNSTLQTRTLGTFGYIAPEYGSEGQVSTACDVYSYGIMLLEVITRKKPTDEIFCGNMSMRQWVQAAFPVNIMQVVDSNLLDESAMDMGNLVLAICEMGLDCSRKLPGDRINIKDVVRKITKIKSQLCKTSA